MESGEKNCCICSSNVQLFQVQEKWICEKCLHIGNEERTAPWKDSIEKLVMEYSEACHRCLSSDDPEDVHKIRVLGRKIQAVLQFIGLPKNHALLLPIRKVHHFLNKIREADVFLDRIETQNEETKVNAEMFKLLSEKQEKMKKRLIENLPNFINNTFLDHVKVFTNEELSSYVVRLEREMALHKKEDHLNQLVGEYYQSAEHKGETSDRTIKLLHDVRKKVKSLRYMYSYFDEVFGEKYPDKETYCKDLQRQFGEIKDLEDWLKLMKSFDKKIDAPKKDIAEVKKNLKRRLKNLLEKVELHEPIFKES